MNFTSLNNLPAWAILPVLAAHLAAGIMLGALYFRNLWWNTRQFALGGCAFRTIAWSIGRFLLLGGVLILASREGALPPLLMALGVLIARAVVIRQVRETAP